MGKNLTNKSRFKISTIPVVALMMAIEIILTRFLSISLQFIRIGFGFIPVALTAIMYGPWWSAVAYAFGDFLGAIAIPTSGGYFPGFTLTAFLTGLTFGIFLHKKEITWKTVLPASLIICFGLNMILDTFWLYIMYGQGVWAMIPARIVKPFIMVPIHLILIPFIWNRIKPFIESHI